MIRTSGGNDVFVGDAKVIKLEKMEAERSEAEVVSGKFEKIIFLFLLIFVWNSLQGSIPEIEDVTLVVGSIRMRGEVPNPVYDLVGQEYADFSHTKSFADSKVISVDMRRCIIDLPHIQGNWLSPDFPYNSQERVVRILFEWFPSHYRSRVPPSLPSCREYQRLLLPALNKAYKVLVPGGKLIIDHIPYSVRLPSNYADAIEILKKCGVSEKILKKHVLRNLTEESKQQPGIVSALWQRYDPFTISMSQCENEDILKFLKGEIIPSLDKQTDLVAVQRSLKRLVEIYKKTRPEIIKRNLIRDLEAEKTGENPSGQLKIFRWVYGMKSRNDLMLNALRTIGFQVDMDIIQCFKKNPYNERHHAWIIKARKPMS